MVADVRRDKDNNKKDCAVKRSKQKEFDVVDANPLVGKKAEMLGTKNTKAK